jgi:hypothetical protein
MHSTLHVPYEKRVYRNHPRSCSYTSIILYCTKFQLFGWMKYIAPKYVRLGELLVFGALRHEGYPLFTMATNALASCAFSCQSHIRRGQARGAWRRIIHLVPRDTRSHSSHPFYFTATRSKRTSRVSRSAGHELLSCLCS